MITKKNDLFVFFGPPGGGKGTLSKLCVERLGWVQLSTGNLCRSHIAQQTEIGKKIDFIIKSGKLIPDSVVTDMIKDWLKDNCSLNTTIIFDGYPRTITQAKDLTELLNADKFSIYKLNLVKLLISQDTIVKRLMARIVCSNNNCQAVYSTLYPKFAPKKENVCDICESSLIKRADDEENVIRDRLAVYDKHESALIDFYQRLGEKILTVDAERSLDCIFEDFKGFIS